MSYHSMPQPWLDLVAGIQSAPGEAADAAARIIPVLDRLAAMSDERILITIDGPCGSGKSTLAGVLAQVIDAPVIHMDDFVVPHAQKTPERLALPGGNADVERLATEVLAPWLMGQPFSYRMYLCHSDTFSPPVTVSPERYLIIEGTYSNLPAISLHAALRLFLTVSPDVQQARLLRRVGSQRLQAFNERWIPLENAYFSAFGLPDEGCMLIDAN